MHCSRDIDLEIAALEGAPSVASAIREIRQHHNSIEVRIGVETALNCVTNVLQHPKDIRMYRVKASNPVFHRTLGHLQSSNLLMNAIGFVGHGDGANIANSKERSFAAYVLKTVQMRGRALNDKSFDMMATGSGLRPRAINQPNH